MCLLTHLLAPKRHRSQQQLACRAAAVVDQVIFDVGIDNFVNGSLLLDRRLRLRFFSGGKPSAGSGIVARVAVGELDEARALRAVAGAAGLDPATLELHTGRIVGSLMRELKAQSAALRALP